MRTPRTKDEDDELVETEVLDHENRSTPDYDPDATAVLDDGTQEMESAKRKRRE